MLIILGIMIFLVSSFLIIKNRKKVLKYLEASNKRFFLAYAIFAIVFAASLSIFFKGVWGPNIDIDLMEPKYMEEYNISDLKDELYIEILDEKNIMIKTFDKQKIILNSNVNDIRVIKEVYENDKTFWTLGLDKEVVYVFEIEDNNFFKGEIICY